jgi:hypothetical protein
MALRRSAPAFGSAKKFYESSAIFSKYISEENIAKVRQSLPRPTAIYTGHHPRPCLTAPLPLARVQLKNLFFYRPNDTHDLHQIPPANTKMPGVERIMGYRYPAPG